MASRILKAALSVAPVCGSVPIAGNVASLAICGYDSSTIVFTRHGSQILSLLYHPRRRKTSPRWRDPDRVGINSLAGTDSEARRGIRDEVESSFGLRRLSHGGRRVVGGIGVRGFWLHAMPRFSGD